MNTTINERYKDLLFDDQQIEMIADMIIDKDTVIKVLNVIKEHSPTKSEPDAHGITKKNIMESLRVHTKIKDHTNNCFVDGTNNLSRNMCDNIISFLTGATLIYYKENHREDLYQLTYRGYQIIKLLKKKGYLE